MGSDSSEYTRGPSDTLGKMLTTPSSILSQRTNDLKALTRLLIDRREQPSAAKCAM